MNIPIISSNVTENREILRAETDGFFASTPEIGSRAILHLAGDQSLRSAMGRAGRTQVE
jgi:glycosyltransferase involved in cell wall biosynthesis